MYNREEKKYIDNHVEFIAVHHAIQPTVLSKIMSDVTQFDLNIRMRCTIDCY